MISPAWRRRWMSTGIIERTHTQRKKIGEKKEHDIKPVIHSLVDDRE